MPTIKTKELDINTGNMPDDSAIKIFEYWKMLKGKQNMPVWEDFDSINIVRDMPNIGLIEERGKYDFYVCVVGENLRNKIDTTAKRQTLREFIPTGQYNNVYELYCKICDTEKPYLISKQVLFPEEEKTNKDLKHTTLLLPFSYGTSKTKHKILSYMIFNKA